MLIGEEVYPAWIQSVDEASNVKENDAIIMIERLDDLLVDQSLRFEVKSRNN